MIESTVVTQANPFATYTHTNSGMSRIHSSGFSTEGQQHIPIRVQRLLTKLNLTKIQLKPDNFVIIVYKLIAIVKQTHPSLDNYFLAIVCVNVLSHIPELTSLEPIFESSVEHFLDLLEKRRRNCEMCSIF